ncbi:MAG: carbohydrate binding family 9 domain-containing protein [Proteobacteria bacterium]|nr:carbohydrate binding family 9 domain-containing protein [Pseudomonadota bacterium]
MQPDRFIFVFIGLLTPFICFAQDIFEPPTMRPSFWATPSSAPISIDGDLNEQVWRQAKAVGDFVQKEPVQNVAATYATEVYVAYDESALYIAAICFQPKGETRVQNLQRDFSFDENDLFGIAIDGFMDQRNAVVFQTTPPGNQRDLQVIDGLESNLNWDAQWTVRTRIYEDRWVAEIAIPWRILRYREGTDRLGIIFARNVRSLNEETSLPAVPRAFSVERMAYSGELRGFITPPSNRSIQLTPYVLWRRLTETNSSDRSDIEVGGELKWAITPNTVLDLTINTDFAQADADHQVINLDRFSVFFPERRQFFLENASIFNASVTEWISPFFSRRIGLDESGGAIPLDGGLRLTSRSSKQQLGLLAMRQQSFAGTPAASFAVARYARNISGQSRFGGMLTYRRDDASSVAGQISDENNNATYTVDGLWKPTQAFAIQGMVSVSDDDKTGTGTGGQLWVSYRSNRMTLSSLHYYNKDYNPGIGLELLDTNYMMNSLIANFDFRSNKFPLSVRSFNPGISAFSFRSSDDNELLFAYVPIRPLRLSFQSGARIDMIIEPNRQHLEESFSPAGIEIAPGEYDYTRYRIYAKTDQSKRFAANVRAETGNYFDGKLRSYSVSTRIAPWPQFELSVDYQINELEDLGVNTESNTTRLYRVNGRFALNPRLQITGFYQRDNLSDRSAWNFRLSWEYRPLSYLFVVYNKNDRSGLTPGSRFSQDQFIVKVTYLFDK